LRRMGRLVGTGYVLLLNGRSEPEP
jgi:hypothetical protein